MWAPDYVDAATVKAVLGISDALDDAAIGLAITSASRIVDQFCGRQFGKTDAPEERTYEAVSDGRDLVLYTDDFMTDVGSVIDGVTTTTNHPRNAPQNGRPWTRIVVSGGVGRGDLVGVVKTWGWTTIPTTVEQATLTQALRLLKRKDAPFGVAGSPDSGSELRLLAKIDPDVAVALSAYRRMGRVA